MRKILASGSPRRKELIEALDMDFEVSIVSVDETVPESIPPREAALYLAKKKNALNRQIHAEDFVLTADTTVVFEDRLLEKPEDFDEAFEMIRTLSNHVHQVITGICMSSPTKTIGFSITTDVKFCELSEDEIRTYINEYHPFDKAGSYGIQEWIGIIGIEWIRGSYYNVVGLPVQQVHHHLKQDFPELLK